MTFDTSTVIAVCSLIIAILTFAFNRNGDSKDSTKAFTEVSVKLDFISNQITSLQDASKENETEIHKLQVTMDEKIEKVRLAVQHAQDTADAAQRRLNRAHIDEKEE